jgi:hypothetical protein
MLVRAEATLGAVLLLSGCSGAATAADVTALASWAASAEMVAEAWAAGTVPRAYGTRAVRTVHHGLKDRRRHLRRHPVGVDIDEALGRLDRAVADLSDAIERGERGRAASTRTRLQAEARTLRAIAGRLEARS